MLIDVISEVCARSEALEGGLKSLSVAVDEKIETLWSFVSPFTGKDFNVMANGINALKQWTGKTTASIVYDSRKDPFTHDGFFCKILGKPNVAIVAFTADGDAFGGFYSVVVTKQNSEDFDPNIFVFSFESHGRCKTPQRFAAKEEFKNKVNVGFSKNHITGFVWFGVDNVGCFTLGNEGTQSTCCCMSQAFAGLEDTTLTGKNSATWTEPPYHPCHRLVAIYLE